MNYTWSLRKSEISLIFFTFTFPVSVLIKNLSKNFKLVREVLNTKLRKVYEQ